MANLPARRVDPAHGLVVGREVHAAVRVGVHVPDPRARARRGDVEGREQAAPLEVEAPDELRTGARHVGQGVSAARPKARPEGGLAEVERAGPLVPVPGAVAFGLAGILRRSDLGTPVVGGVRDTGRQGEGGDGHQPSAATPRCAANAGGRLPKSPFSRGRSLEGGGTGGSSRRSRVHHELASGSPTHRNPRGSLDRPGWHGPCFKRWSSDLRGRVERRRARTGDLAGPSEGASQARRFPPERHPALLISSRGEIVWSPRSDGPTRGLLISGASPTASSRQAHRPPCAASPCPPGRATSTSGTAWLQRAGPSQGRRPRRLRRRPRCRTRARTSP